MHLGGHWHRFKLEAIGCASLMGTLEFALSSNWNEYIPSKSVEHTEERGIYPTTLFPRSSSGYQYVCSTDLLGMHSTTLFSPIYKHYWSHHARCPNLRYVPKMAQSFDGIVCSVSDRRLPICRVFSVKFWIRLIKAAGTRLRCAEVTTFGRQRVRTSKPSKLGTTYLHDVSNAVYSWIGIDVEDRGH